MKYTGNKCLRIGKDEYMPGDTLPDNVTIDKKVLAKMKENGEIDGRLSDDAYAKAEEQVKLNQAKKAKKKSEPDTDPDEDIEPVKPEPEKNGGPK
jgi:hypothetical protein